jgi:hypothetical protein
MDKKKLNNLTALEQMFQHTCQVCDPLDYQIRQRNLLYTLTNYLLLPLMEYREEEKKNASDAMQSTSIVSTDLPISDEVKNAVESV